MLHPGERRQGRAALTQGDKENIAPQVRSENGEELGTRDLAVAHDLDGGRGGNAEAGIVTEEVTYGDREQNQSGDRHDHGNGGDDTSDAGRRGKTAANRHTTPGTQESVFLVVQIVAGSLSGARAGPGSPGILLASRC